MPATASRPLQGRFRPSLAFAAKTALCFEATFQRIEIHGANAASRPGSKPDVCAREFSAPLLDLCSVACGVAEAVASLRRLLTVGREREDFEALTRISKSEPFKNGFDRSPFRRLTCLTVALCRVRQNFHR